MGGPERLVHAPLFPRDRSENWYIVLELQLQEKGKVLLGFQRITRLQNEESSLVTEEMVFRPLEREGYTNYRLHIVSDSMMGLDYRKDFRLYLWPRGVENDGKGADDYYDS